MELIIKNKEFLTALRTKPQHMRMGQWLWSKFLSNTALSQTPDANCLFHTDDENWEAFFYRLVIIDYNEQ